MKKLLLLSFIITLFSSYSNAQDTALTKEETINYINKKLIQVIDYDYKGYYVTAISIRLDGQGNVVHDTEYKSAKTQCYITAECPSTFKKSNEKCTFNPMHITKMEEISTTGSVGVLRVHLVPQTGKIFRTFVERQCEEKYRTYSYYDAWNILRYEDRFEGYKANCNETNSEDKADYINFIFLKADPTNYNKLVKAFNHLASLAKAEDDPFGE